MHTCTVNVQAECEWDLRAKHKPSMLAGFKTVCGGVSPEEWPSISSQMPSIDSLKNLQLTGYNNANDDKIAELFCYFHIPMIRRNTAISTQLFKPQGHTTLHMNRRQRGVPVILDFQLSFY